MQDNSQPVQGYIFTTSAEPESELGARSGDVCKIMGRATDHEATERELLDLGPAFRVEFGDGHQEVAFSIELNPWYPVD